MPRNVLHPLVVSVIVVAACSKPPPKAQGFVFTSPDGRFSITFPQKPTETTVELKGGNTGRQYEVDLGERTYLVGTSPVIIGNKKIEDVLTMGRDNLLQAMEGKLLSEAPLEMRGYPGREILMLLPDGLVHRVRVIAAGDLAIQVIVACPRGEETSPATNDFFDTFQLLR